MTKKTSKTTANKAANKAAGKKNITIEDQDKNSQAAENKKKEEDKPSEEEVVELPETEDTSETREDESAPEEEPKEDATEKFEAEAKLWHDKYLRLSAEFDNYRKRTLKEKTDLIKVANEDLLKDILAVVDDFDRGVDHLDKSEDLEALKEGIHLIHNKFKEFLKQKGIKEIEAKEQTFDLDYHEAVTKIPAPNEGMKGKVVDVIEKGYMLNDKVIRYAKVVVGD
jgi:molecular chaperone GrpE